MADDPDFEQVLARIDLALHAAENIRVQYVERSLILARSAALSAAVERSPKHVTSREMLLVAEQMLDYIVSGKVPPENRRW